MMRNNSGCFLRTLIILSVLMLSGCGKGASKQPAERAEDVVEKFLDSWSRGEAPETFTDPSQPIEGSDPDRNAGYRLLSFLTIESKQSEEGADRFRCRVSLSLQDRKGKKLEKEVVYAVQLGERSTLRRIPR